MAKTTRTRQTTGTRNPRRKKPAQPAQPLKGTESTQLAKGEEATLEETATKIEVSSESKPALTEEEVCLAVARHSTKLRGELYELAKSEIASEERQRTALLTRASTLMGAAGLSVSLVLAVGGRILADHAKSLGGWLMCLAIILGVAALLGVAATGFAALAMLVKKTYPKTNERTIFDPEQLREADDKLWDGKDDIGRKEEQALADYRRWLIPHLWIIQRQISDDNEKRWTLARNNPHRG